MSTAKENFLETTGLVVSASLSQINNVVDDLRHAVKKLTMSNESLADKLRRANEEVAGLRELHRAAKEMQVLHRNRIPTSEFYDAVREVSRAVNELPSPVHQEMQRDLTFALERLADASPEHHPMIRAVSHRYNLPVMMPVFGDETEKNDRFTVELSSPEEGSLKDALVNGLGVISQQNGTISNLDEVLKAMEAAIDEEEHEDALVVQAFAARVLPALVGLEDNTEVHLFMADDGMVGIAVDPEGIPAEWFDKALEAK